MTTPYFPHPGRLAVPIPALSIFLDGPEQQADILDDATAQRLRACR